VAQAQAPADPVVARVSGVEIRVSDVSEAAQGLPAEYRSMPQNVLIPMLTDQLIDRAAVVAMARRAGLDKEPTVARAVARAVDEALENAQMRRDIEPTLTDAALRERYVRDVAGKEGEVEVHARHILLGNEADAVKAIAEIKKGGDFAAIAKERSSDPGAGQGGDLGFFKKADMVPEFAEVAFALKAGEISEKPVKTQFGWHVIKVEERRAAPPPSFEQSQEPLRQALIQEGVMKLLAAARAGVVIERFNADGSVRKATDDAMPPGLPKP
jgi:peptidyl-prolyl cis-trans isomerase C